MNQFFETLCRLLCLEHLTTTDKYLQTNGQVENYHKTIIARLRHYIARQQNNWNIFVQQLTYANNTKVHRCSGVSQLIFGAVLDPPRATTVDFSNATPSDISGSGLTRLLRNRLLAKLALNRKKIYRRLTAAQKRYKDDHDPLVLVAPVFQTKKLLFLDRPPLVVSTDNSKTTYRRTENNLLRISYEPYCIVGDQMHIRNIDENGVPNTMSINRAMPESSSNTNARVGRKPSAIEGKSAITENAH